MLSYGKSFNFKFATLFAYGTPFLITLLNASISLGSIDRDKKGKLHENGWINGNGLLIVNHFAESSYRAQNFCWLHQYSLYFGFLLVVGILLLFNVFVFLAVIPKITCKRTKVTKMQCRV